MAGNNLIKSYNPYSNLYLFWRLKSLKCHLLLPNIFYSAFLNYCNIPSMKPWRESEIHMVLFLITLIPILCFLTSLTQRSNMWWIVMWSVSCISNWKNNHRHWKKDHNGRQPFLQVVCFAILQVVADINWKQIKLQILNRNNECNDKSTLLLSQ